MTIPGIHIVVAVGIIAAIGPIERFASPRHMVSYLGLNPSVHQSGNGRSTTGESPSAGVDTRVACWSRLAQAEGGGEHSSRSVARHCGGDAATERCRRALWRELVRRAAGKAS
jgi:transposase